MSSDASESYFSSVSYCILIENVNLISTGVFHVLLLVTSIQLAKICQKDLK